MGRGICLLTIAVTLAIWPCRAAAQDMDKDYSTGDDFVSYEKGLRREWVRAFSPEGIAKWRPEITCRLQGGFVTSGPSVTASIRVDKKRSLGIMVGKGDTYIDANPADIYAIQTCLYKRRYLYLGRQDIVALYSDIFLGTEWVYKVEGNYGNRGPGDVQIYAGWQPGVRLRIVKNFHLFLGQTISTNCIGIHIGVGI